MCLTVCVSACEVAKLRSNRGISFGAHNFTILVQGILQDSPQMPSCIRGHGSNIFSLYRINKRAGMEIDTRKQEEGKDQRTIVNSFYIAIKSFGTTLPMLLGVILLLGLFSVFVTSEMISSVFTGELLRDTVIGSLIGSISAGNPIISYIIGGELLKEQVSLFAVAAFIVAWVTVGVLQFPAEAAILGKRFAIARNILGFILAIVVSIATVTTLTLMAIP